MADDRRRKRDLSTVDVDDDSKRRKLHSYTLGVEDDGFDEENNLLNNYS